VQILYQGRQAGIKDSNKGPTDGNEKRLLSLPKFVLLILLRRRSHRNELAKQRINDDCGRAKSATPCWQDNNQSERN
jgi:hypothetical protein